MPISPKSSPRERAGGKAAGHGSAQPKPSPTPAMRQYREQKAEVGDAILLFRMGDFYETFYEDARTVSRVLGLTLTSRNKSSEEPIPLAGVPYHAVQGYIAKLVRAGYKVAISEQVEDPRQAKGVVKRRVERVITPGTLTDETLLDERTDNYLVALCPGPGAVVGDRGSGSHVRAGNWDEGLVGLACVELASGRFFAQVLSAAAVIDELARLRPAEVLVPETGLDVFSLTEGSRPDAGGSSVDAADPFPRQLRDVRIGQWHITQRQAHVFDAHMAERALCEHFRVASLAGFGFDRFDISLCAAAALLDYLKETQRTALDHILKIVPRRSEGHVLIDRVALRSLEVERTMREGGREGSLLGAIDMTVNPMGARRLREWLCFPLRDVEEIRARQDAITELRDQPEQLRRLREILREMGDAERIVARLGVGRASPRDMVGLGRALHRCAEVVDCGLRIAGLGFARESKPLDPRSSIVDAQAAGLLTSLAEALSGHEELATFLTTALKEDAALASRRWSSVGRMPVPQEEGFIADGYNDELDRLRNVGQQGHRWLAEFQAREAERAGIPTLKVGYNSVFGYYIEVTHQHRDKVPPEYVRRQTVRNAERYITDELKRHENEVLGAADQARQLELELFKEICCRAAAELPRLQAMTEAVAALDVLASLAELSRQRDYCRPGLIVDCEPKTVESTPQSAIVLEIVDGRHPVLDVTMAERFVPNDCHLAGDGDRLLVITGPNMAGKSTYIRQAALLVLLAQTGSYVPAKSMRWSPVDRIFARVGATDELARGQSTFMVEMVETSRILHNATAESLVILDEIGRGTSTYDGLALAWAITEYISQHIGCRALFATHYHELTELAEQLAGVANFNVAVREVLRPDGTGRDVVFLHRIVPGSTDRSYGVHVAAMAGLPASVLKRGEAILAELEGSFTGRSRTSALAAGRQDAPSQLLLFPSQGPMPDWWRELVDALGNVDIDRTTPFDALSLLRRLRGIMRGERTKDEG